MNQESETGTEKAGTSRCGFVAIIGAPNAGKSTLLNQLVGSKVAIVTHKVQTTRARIRGIAMEGDTQIVFVDTPGIFKPKRRLDKAMVEAAWGGAGDADLIILMVDAEHERAEDLERILEGLKEQGRKAILVLNKVDTANREKLLKLAQRLDATGLFTRTFMISALTGDGVKDLRAYIAGEMPEGPWHYPEDQAADVPLRSLAAEVTREKLFLRLHDELPYSLTVETESWETKKDGSVRIQQVIFVERDSQKKIALGKGGQTIKTVGQLAREELQEMLGTKVHLFLFVKVRENWSDDRERYREMGLDFPEK
ncbi:MAG: GTPase Era [Parvibaculum sp.]|jgi:GTP-binding protein Era|uniref:GTPase Era n=1 Tax=Parvibaculum sp. TaxID=2024848 RepID=UPI000C4A07C9|nr:GTPase Era [Parvibaculum sp.]MAU59110.1 GTPase Era [Parvibaculum sp.]HAC58111.1 GTPase Era [Rhodobiaceae bacterium]|tara:strand:+ start:486 stop:1418 length:933 start_codon:yes stop_codon:yes gene_type:complete